MVRSRRNRRLPSPSASANDSSVLRLDTSPSNATSPERHDDRSAAPGVVQGERTLLASDPGRDSVQLPPFGAVGYGLLNAGPRRHLCDQSARRAEGERVPRRDRSHRFGRRLYNPAQKAARTATSARSALDNAMFAVDDFTVFPGVNVAYVNGGFTAQAEATLSQLTRVRGATDDKDPSTTRRRRARRLLPRAVHFRSRPSCVIKGGSPPPSKSPRTRPIPSRQHDRGLRATRVHQARGIDVVASRRLAGLAPGRSDEEGELQDSSTRPAVRLFDVGRKPLSTFPKPTVHRNTSRSRRWSIRGKRHAN